MSSNSRPRRSRPATSMTVRRLDRALSMLMSGVTSNVSAAWRVARARGDRLGQADLAAEGALHGERDAAGAAQLVLVALEGARHVDHVERQAVRGGEDLRIDDVGGRRGAGPGDGRQQARVVGGDHRQLGDAARRVRQDVDGGAGRADLRHVEQVGVADLVGEIDLQPVGAAGGAPHRRRNRASSRSAARRAALRAPPRCAARAPPQIARRRWCSRSRGRARAAAPPSSCSTRRGRPRGCRRP